MMTYELDDTEKEVLLGKVVERARADLNEGRPLTEMRCSAERAGAVSGEHVEKCSGCGELIDPELCWCGQSINHGPDNHPIASMGCNCYRDDADADYASAPHPSAHYERGPNQ